MSIRTFGAILSPQERQEGEREAPALASGQAPPLIDFRPALPPVWNQEAEGSCVGHATAGLAAFLWPQWEPSRRDPYWQARNLLGMTGPDGAHLAAALKAGQRWGYLPNDKAPYLAGNRGWVPPSDADELREAHHFGTYWRLALTLGQAHDALWLNGPIAAVVAVDSAFNAAERGLILRPTPGAEQGLHAVCIVGIDLTRELLLVRNSWGPEWGDQGHAWVSWLWLATRMREAWQASKGDGEPSPRPIWEMLWPGVFLQASASHGYVA